MKGKHQAEGSVEMHCGELQGPESAMLSDAGGHFSGHVQRQGRHPTRLSLQH